MTSRKDLATRPLTGFRAAKERWLDNATEAMLDNPRYFAWWYTVKSIALVGAIGTAAYYAGKANGMRYERGRQ